MGKLQNESNNLEEILAALVAGNTVQFEANGEFITYIPRVHDSCFKPHMLNKRWRVKTDAIEEALEKFRGHKMPATLEEIAKYFWNAAIENQNK
jgi:hypothetical protein